MNINGRDREIIVIKKRIKNIYFRLDDDGNIVVTCPRFCSKYEIDSLLEENKKNLERMDKKREKRQEDTNKILLLGKELDYVYYTKIMFQDNMAFGPSIDSINEYLEKKSLKYFQERMDLYIDSYKNIPKFRLRIRKMKSRWGVCNISSMTITLNSLLIHKSPFLIDYVINHELSHFHHMDHSSEFWEEVGRHFPEYKKARKELKE